MQWHLFAMEECHTFLMCTTNVYADVTIRVSTDVRESHVSFKLKVVCKPNLYIVVFL